MMITRNIFLVGATACGKTTLGKHLAERLACDFFDSDAAIEERIGLSIADIFAREGEQQFRKYEIETLAELTGKQRIVLAIGAGAVAAEENRRRLRQRGIVIYVQVNIQTQLARTANDQSRPLLKGRNTQTVLEKMRRRRAGYYREIAHICVNGDNKNIAELADELINALDRYIDKAPAGNAP